VFVTTVDSVFTCPADTGVLAEESAGMDPSLWAEKRLPNITLLWTDLQKKSN
jgi:hypothetical protein